MEYAHGAWDFNSAWDYRSYCRLRTFLPCRARLSSRPCSCTDHDVFKIVGSGASNDLPYTNTRTFLVHPSCKDFMDGCSGYTNRSNIDSRVWNIYDATGLGMG